MKYLNDIKIKTKLWILGSVSILGLIFVGTLSLIITKQINQASTDISQMQLNAIVIAEELNTATSDYRLKEYHHVITEDLQAKKKLEDEMVQLREQISQRFDAYVSYGNSTEDRIDMEKAHKLWQRYLENSSIMLSLSWDHDKGQVLQLMIEESKTLFDEMCNTFLKVVAVNTDRAEQASRDGDQLYATLTMIQTISIILIAGFITILVVYMIRAIEKPVDDIVDGVRKVSNGDLDVHLDYGAKDEIGILTDSVNELVQRLRDMIDDERYLFQEIGNENYHVESSCQQAYRGDFAPILYSIENLKSRIEQLQLKEKESKDDNRTMDAAD